MREFLLKELKMARNMVKYSEAEFDEVFDDKNYVRVPVESKNEKNEPIREFKTFKIIQKLDSSPNGSDKKKLKEKHLKDKNGKSPRKYGQKKRLGNIFYDGEGNKVLDVIHPTYKHYKPKEMLNIFPNEFSFNLLLSCLNEKGAMKTGEIAELIGYCESHIHTLYNQIIAKDPNIINREKRKTKSGKKYFLSLNSDCLAKR